jgi:hypothetical protein
MKTIQKTMDFDLKNESYQKILSEIDLTSHVMIVRAINVININDIIQIKILGNYWRENNANICKFINFDTLKIIKKQLFKYNALKQYKDNL